MTGFDNINISEALQKGLKKQGITQPTAIQSETFAKIEAGNSLLAQSRTGSGKTLAYLLPLINQMGKTPESGNRVLILVPTHELAVQVLNQIRSLSKDSAIPFCGAAIVGNVNIARQIENLREKPQFVVGTPGRIFELIKKKKIAAHLIKTVVIDEADKMLAKEQLAETIDVIKCCMRDAQKLFFSASMGKDAVLEASKLVPGIDEVRIEAKDDVTQDVKHYYSICEGREKPDRLRSILTELHPKKVIIFVNQVYDIELVTKKLKYHHYQAECIHGSLKKQDREKAIRSFRDNKLNILVSTDLAARGLHFEDVDMVIHCSIPEQPKDYLHRAGRTGRNGKKGVSISFVTKTELKRLLGFAGKLGITFEEMKKQENTVKQRNRKRRKNI